MANVYRVLIMAMLIVGCNAAFKRKQEKSKCPKINPSRSLDLQHVSCFLLLLYRLCNVHKWKGV